MTSLIPASLNCSERRELLGLLEERALRRSREDCEESFAEFVRQAWHVLEPTTPLRWNWHLDTICGYLEALESRRIKRLIITVPPGTMKSLLVSVFYPAWVWVRDPGHRFLSVANGDNLAVRDAQRHKWLVESDWYRARWQIDILKDQSGKGLFGNNHKGVRQGIGMTANVTGLRGDTLLWDDLLDALKAFSDAARAEAIEAIDQKLSNRLNDQTTGGIVLIMQRLHEDDPAGHLLRSKKEKWVHLSIPMEYDGPRYDASKDIGLPELNDPRTKDGELLDANRFSPQAIDALKERLGSYGSAGQLQQRPAPLGGGILKKSAWQKWEKDKPFPTCHHIFASYDTAYSEADHKAAAYSARTTWGVFDDDLTGRTAMILLDAWYERADFAALKREARRHYKEAGCDRLLIERKASGISLIQEMRRWRGVSVRGYDPGRLDKIGRAHMALPMLESGLVYYPDRAWAEKVVDYVAAFPTGAPPSADLCDTITQAINYVRRKGWAQPSEDDRRDDLEARDQTEEEIDDAPPKKRAAYG
jgi:predicted phage terminase large subunit-like protein